MKFSQRLAYYLLGFLIGGTIVLWFMDSKGTSFCYLPNCRVLKDLRSKPLVTSEQAKQDLQTFSMEDLKNCLTYGTVDFSKSNTKPKEGKTYIIEGRDANNREIVVEMINYSDKAMVQHISYK